MAKRVRTQNASASSEAAEAVNIGSGDHAFVNAIQGVYVGGAGDLVVRLRGDDADATFKNVAAGTVLPICPSIVRQTNTTATFILGLI